MLSFGVKNKILLLNIGYFQFLETQRIHNLTKYLQALHKAQRATEEHTTLLLNCYTKLKDVSKLDEFIMVRFLTINTIMNIYLMLLYESHEITINAPCVFDNEIRLNITKLVCTLE